MHNITNINVTNYAIMSLTVGPMWYFIQWIGKLHL